MSSVFCISSRIWVVQQFSPICGFIGGQHRQKLCLGDGSIMPQERQLSFRRLTRRRSMINPHEIDDRCWTPLHIGARKRDLKLVRRLVDEGADVNVVSLGSKSPRATPLHLAAIGGHLKVMDELLERGANIDAGTKGSCGSTPLDNVAKENNKKSIEFLIENGAFLPPDMNDRRFNPGMHYYIGLEWAYEIKSQRESSTSASEGACSEGTISDKIKRLCKQK